MPFLFNQSATCPCVDDRSYLRGVAFAVLGRFTVISANGGPRVAVLVDLFLIQPSGDENRLAWIEEVIGLNAILAQVVEVDTVSLCAANVDASIFVLVDLLPTAAPCLDARDSPKNPWIYSMVCGRFIEAVSGGGRRNPRY